MKELKLGSEFALYGKKYKILVIKPPDVVIQRVEGDQETIEINFLSLVTHPSFKIKKANNKREVEKELKKYKSLLDSLPEHRREEVSQRFELIRPILVLEKVKQNDIKAIIEFKNLFGKYLKDSEDVIKLTQEELIQRISNKTKDSDNPISTRTIKRHLSAFRNSENEMPNQGLEGLVSKSGKGYIERTDNQVLEICHPNKKDVVLDTIYTRLDPNVVPIVKDAIEKIFLTTKRVSKAALHTYIEVVCEKKDIIPPPYITIAKLVDRIDPKVKVRMRDGQKASEMYDEVIRGFSDEEAYYPLHIVEIDHTELDMDVLDDSSGFVIGRPWITMGICVYSRMVWCLHVSFEPPSANKVRKAIENGIFFKRSKERFNTINEWEVFGIPKIILMDNGPDFKSADVKRMITETLGSEPRYRPVRTPRYGATIERLFGTINSKLIHNLDGTRKSNRTALGEYEPEKDAAFTLKDIIELLTWYITDQYHYDKHTGLPLESPSPIVRYREGLKIGGYPEWIDLEDEELYSLELLPTILKPYTRDGIRFGNVFYRTSKLSNLIGPRTVKYKVKHDIDDISKVYLQLPKSDEYVEVPAVNPPAEELSGMNRYTYNKIQEYRRQVGDEKRNAIPGTQEISQTKARIIETAEKKYKSSRNIRKQIARMGLDVSISEPKIGASNKGVKSPSLKDLINAARAVEKENITED